MKRFLLAMTLIGLATATIAAKVPGTTWQGLLNRQVVVTCTDGTRDTGTLALVKGATISLVEADGSVVTVAKGRVEGVRPVTASTQSLSTTANGSVGDSAVTVNPAPRSQSTNTRAGSRISMAIGMRDADVRYHSGWFWGGLFLGLIGVAFSYSAHPTPSATPGTARVDVSSYLSGYQKEAKKRAHRSAWTGFATRAVITSLVALIAVANAVSHFSYQLGP